MFDISVLKGALLFSHIPNAGHQTTAELTWKNTVRLFKADMVSNMQIKVNIR